MKPIKDAKSTVRGLGAEELEELDAPPPPSRAVNAVAPRSSRPGSYAHVPPKRITRELALDAIHGKSERGGTLRPPAPTTDPED